MYPCEFELCFPSRSNNTEHPGTGATELELISDRRINKVLHVLRTEGYLSTCTSCDIYVFLILYGCIPTFVQWTQFLTLKNHLQVS